MSRSDKSIYFEDNKNRSSSLNSKQYSSNLLLNARPILKNQLQQINLDASPYSLPSPNLFSNAKKLTKIDHQSLLQEKIKSIQNILDEFQNIILNQNLQPHYISKIQQIILLTSQLISKSTYHEVLNNELKSNLAKLSIQNQKLTCENQKLHKLLQLSKLDKQALQNDLKNFQTDISDMTIKEQTTKKGVTTLTNKVHILEKRLEMATDQNTFIYQDSFRNTLAELIKENESQKRSLQLQGKNQKSLKEQISKLQSKNVRLNKKLEGLKMKGTSEDQAEEKIGPEFIMDAYNLPNNLEFRDHNLKIKQLDNMMDLIEHGPEAFSNQVNIIEDHESRKQLILLICNQFLVMKEFAEKHQSFMKASLNLIVWPSQDQFVLNVAREFHDIISCENIILWMFDNSTGVLFTFNFKGDKKRIIISYGVFKDAIQSRKVISRFQTEKSVLYQDDNCNNVLGSRFIVVPIQEKENGVVLGLLEISHLYSNNYLIDDQYFAVLLARYIGSSLIRLQRNEQIEKRQMYKEVFLQEFLKLSYTKSKQDFNRIVQNISCRLFHQSQIQILFVENNQFYRFDQIQELKIHAITGVAGLAYVSQQGSFVKNIRMHKEFNSSIDLNSLLTVYTYPILSEIDDKFFTECLGVIQIVLKKQLKLTEENLKMQEIESEIKEFCKFIGLAYIQRNGKLKLYSDEVNN